MSTSIVSDWFGSDFLKLHPLLQELHKSGGKLSGGIQVSIPNGLSGVLGHHLAKKLGVPTIGTEHTLEVFISHQDGCLHWDRRFDGIHTMKSVFRPIGNRNDGYWLEKTGPISMKLTVDSPDGGWYWRCLSVRLYKFRFPMWLFPNSEAYKRIEDGRYRFYVGFSLPIVGTILSYGGVLSLSVSGDKID